MIRNATMNDSESILTLVNQHAGKGLMLAKTPYAIYKSIPNFIVYEKEGKVLGCCRLDISWVDLAEVASLAVAENETGKRIGSALVKAIIRRAQELNIPTLFSLSYQVDFFKKQGFQEIDRNSLPYKVFGECLNCPKVNCCDEHAFILDIRK